MVADYYIIGDKDGTLIHIGNSSHNLDEINQRIIDQYNKNGEVKKIYNPNEIARQSKYTYSFAVANFSFMGNAVVLGIFGEDVLFDYMIFTLPLCLNVNYNYSYYVYIIYVISFSIYLQISLSGNMLNNINQKIEPICRICRRKLLSCNKNLILK